MQSARSNQCFIPSPVNVNGVTDISCQESDESDSELVLLQEEMERREAELEEEAAEEADLTVGYNSPTNTPLSLTFRYCSVHA